MKGAARFVAVAGTLTVFCLSAPAVLAAWSATGAGPAAAAAATMPAGGQPTGTATGGAVSLRWPAVALSNGVPVAGYVVSRFNALNGAQATVGAGCSGVITTTTCTEQAVPPGSWIYTDTPVLLSWSGGASPGSAPIVVT